MVTAKEICEKLCDEKTLNQIIKCMEITNHRWALGKRGFQIPTKAEVKENIILLIQEIKKLEGYETLWEKNYASCGGITINCELNLNGREWSMSYTPIRTYVFAEMKETLK